MRTTLKCFVCKLSFEKETLINYNANNYCKKCYEEKRAAERFADFVCRLFSIKSPGPKIYSQRKMLKQKYGFTDDTIVMALDYLFNIKKLDKSFESLGLINPESVDEARSYFASINSKAKNLKESLMNMNVETVTIPVMPNNRVPKKDLLNPKDYLE